MPDDDDLQSDLDSFFGEIEDGGLDPKDFEKKADGKPGDEPPGDADQPEFLSPEDFEVDSHEAPTASDMDAVTPPSEASGGPTAARAAAASGLTGGVVPAGMSTEDADALIASILGEPPQTDEEAPTAADLEPVAERASEQSPETVEPEPEEIRAEAAAPVEAEAPAEGLGWLDEAAEAEETVEPAEEPVREMDAGLDEAEIEQVFRQVEPVAEEAEEALVEAAAPAPAEAAAEETREEAEEALVEAAVEETAEAEEPAPALAEPALEQIAEAEPAVAEAAVESADTEELEPAALSEAAETEPAGKEAAPWVPAIVFDEEAPVLAEPVAAEEVVEAAGAVAGASVDDDISRPWRWVALGAWGFMIWALSTAPPANIPEIGVVGIDKVAHAVVFAVLAVLLARTLYGERPTRPAWLIFMLAVAACVLYGGLSEYHQAMGVVGRTGSAWDLAADAAGAFVGAVVYLVTPAEAGAAAGGSGGTPMLAGT